MERTKFKIRGFAHVYTLPHENNRLGVCYKTSIFTNPQDPLFINKLTALGFQIISYYGKRIEVILPKGWTHIRVSKDMEFIMDAESRKRINLDTEKKTSQLLRRFDFTLDMISTIAKEGEDKQQALMGHILDAGEIIQSYPVNSLEMQSFMHIHPQNDEELMETFKDAMGKIIAESYPEWQNELLYWNE